MRDHFIRELTRVFATTPIEDGIAHPAEGLIAADLQSTGLVLERLTTEHPVLAASILRVLGRLPCPGTASWRFDLIQAAVMADVVDLRDAAVQAVELWEDPDLIDVLKQHTEPEPWLQRYIHDVIRDTE